MQLPTATVLSDLLAKFKNLVYLGDKNRIITGINEIHKVRSGDLTFVDHPKYYKRVLQSDASAILINQKMEVPVGKTLVVCQNPFSIYNQLARRFCPASPLQGTVGKNTRIHPTAIIEPGVVIGNQVEIGKNCHIQNNVTIRDHCIIRDGVVIQSGTVVGADAFYFQPTPEGYQKWHTAGRVIIKEKADIGPNCTICRGVSGDTIIGKGTKLDGQVHIGHGVVIGDNCLLAAQVGIGGKTIIGNRVTLYGQVGVAPRLHIEDDVVVLAKSGVTKNLKTNKRYFGYPAGEVKRMYKELAALRSLPDLLKKFYR